MTDTITTSTWWKAAGMRALRTAVVIAVPYIGGASLLGIPWLSVASAVVLGGILSLLTSLAGIAETSGSSVPVWLALLERVTKTAAQSLVAGVGTAVFVTDVDWAQVLQAAALASLGSLLIGVLGYLPEANAPVQPTPIAPVVTTPTVIPSTDVAPTTPADPDQAAAGTPPSA